MLAAGLERFSYLSCCCIIYLDLDLDYAEIFNFEGITDTIATDIDLHNTGYPSVKIHPT